MRIKHSKKLIANFFGSLSLTLMGFGNLAQEDSHSQFLRNYLSFWFNQKAVTLYKKAFPLKGKSKITMFFSNNAHQQPVAINETDFGFLTEDK